MMIEIRHEKVEEYFTVERVTREAFLNVYKPGCDEHLMIKQLRKSEAFIPQLDFVAVNDGIIIGNVICSKVRVVCDDTHTENTEEVITIGPIGVIPQYQKSGIGSMLINKVKESAKDMGFKGIVIWFTRLLSSVWVY